MRTEAPTPSESATYSQLLHAPGVPLVFTQSLTNVLGHSLQIFALSVLIYRQTGSAAWSTLAFAAGFLPQLVGGAVLTSLADRWPARPVLAASAATRAAVALLLALGGLSPGVAIGVVALVAMWQPVPLAVQSALVTRLLTGDLYVLGRSVFNLISSGAQLLGLALGGAVIASLGPSATFLVAATIHLLGMLASLAIRAQGGEQPPQGPWRLGETWTGNLRLLRNHAVRRILLSWWVPITLLVGAEALVVAYVGESNGSPTQTGILLAAFPAGAAVGDVVVGRWLTPGLRRRIAPSLYTLLGAALLPLAWYPGTIATVTCFAIASAATAYQLGSQQAFLDAVPVDRRGLAFGLFGSGLMVGQGVGPVVAGALADVIGSGATMTVLGMTVLASALFLARLPRVRMSPRPRT
ncbi:MAG TPA: MFS transporter [Actinomycetota bacterium]|nr:MFS transporter [Actinomycetota bacterium]